MAWTGILVWWTGADDIVSATMLSLSGAIVGATWYGAMRRAVLRRRVAPGLGDGSSS